MVLVVVERETRVIKAFGILMELHVWKTLMFASFGDYGYMSVVKSLPKLADFRSSCVRTDFLFCSDKKFHFLYFPPQ